MTWEDAPSHICRGGDIRGLAFCCPPVKPCPVLNALQQVNLTPQEFIDIKVQFGKETRLGEGAGTCFGSLVWCCKPSKPCPLRDMTLRNMGMSHVNKPDPDERAEALAETFHISKLEAMNVLTECNNDLRAAVKVLHARSLEDSD